MEDFLNQIYFGNTILKYIWAIGIFVLVIIVVKIFRTIILSRLKKWAEKTKTTLDDFIIIGIQKSVVPILYFGALYIALRTLSLSLGAANILNIASIIVAFQWSSEGIFSFSVIICSLILILSNILLIY